jgi:hypothetical protein
MLSAASDIHRDPGYSIFYRLCRFRMGISVGTLGVKEELLPIMPPRGLGSNREDVTLSEEAIVFLPDIIQLHLLRRQ